MSDVTIYHNPRCTKSRQTLTLLQERGLEPKVILYLQEPLSVETIHQLLQQLGFSPRELMRTKENVYKELALDDPQLSDDALVKAMVDNPILIERPIVVHQQKAAVGRPPENVLAIL